MAKQLNRPHDITLRDSFSLSLSLSCSRAHVMFPRDVDSFPRRLPAAFEMPSISRAAVVKNVSIMQRGNRAAFVHVYKFLVGSAWINLKTIGAPRAVHSIFSANCRTKLPPWRLNANIDSAFI